MYSSTEQYLTSQFTFNPQVLQLEMVLFLTMKYHPVYKNLWTSSKNICKELDIQKI